MKVIRVVHSETDADPSSDETAFLLENYKFDAISFVAGSTRVPFGQPNFSFSALSAIAAAAGAAAAKATVPALSFYEHIQLVENVAVAVVKDIRKQRDRVSVITLKDAKSKYPRTQNLAIGTYALHPYDSGRLTRLESYHTSLAMEKDDELINLLGKMGARIVKITEREREVSSGGGTASASGAGVVDGAAGVNMRKQSETGTDLVVEFEGNQVKIDEDLLTNSLWFSTDSKLNSILSSRRFNPNKIEHYTLTSTYQQTFDFDFELAARYVMVGADIKGQYSSLCKKERLFHVDFRSK